ncbi:MAG: phage major capsid protein [Adlercreutzia sp.]|nr:phage major capsid protein [Adlercreutzia sp.]
MKFKSKKEALDAMRVKFAEMKAAETEEDFDAKNAEFEAYKKEVERFDALEAAEKAFVAEQPAAEPAADAAGEVKALKEGGEEAAVKAFAAAARKNFSEGSMEDGGYTVPEVISTKIEKLRDAKFSLRNIVSVRTVKTKSGKRTFQKRGAGSGFASVDEGGKIPKLKGPKFYRRPWEVQKYGGFMNATNELLDDSDANIADEVAEWFAENSRVTYNLLVLATLMEPYSRTDDPKATAKVKTLDDLKRILNVDLGQAFAPTSRIVTNDDGLQWLDTLKDGDGHSLVKVNENNPLERHIAVGFRRVPLEIVPNGDLPTGEDGVPVIVGDLKEACEIEDRKLLSLKASDVAVIGTGEDAVNAFEEDSTVWRGIVRLDCILKDEEAYRYGLIDTTATAAANVG